LHPQRVRERTAARGGVTDELREIGDVVAMLESEHR
jgi:hypothetical protein